MELSELRTIEHGVRGGWKIPRKLLDNLPTVLGNIIANPKSSDRDRIAASRVLVQMEKASQPQITLHAHEHRHLAPQIPPPIDKESLSAEQRRSELARRIALLRENR